MTTGLLLILLTGLVWAGLGVVSGTVARRGLDAAAYLTAGTLMSTLASWILLPNWPVLLAGDVERGAAFIPLIFGAGLLSTASFFFLQKAMIGGAAAWAVGQSAMVIPFLTGILFFGEPVSAVRLAGVAAIVGSLLAFMKAQQSSPAQQGHWLAAAIVAMLLAGATQVMASIPSSWEGWQDRAGLRIPIVQSAGSVLLLCLSVVRRRWPATVEWKWGLCNAVLILSGLMLLFAGLDHLGREGRLALAYPLALGSCIVLVAAYDVVVWKHPCGRWRLIGIAGCVLGIVMLGLGK